jgi:hypothetical protein
LERSIQAAVAQGGAHAVHTFPDGRIRESHNTGGEGILLGGRGVDLHFHRYRLHTHHRSGGQTGESGERGVMIVKQIHIPLLMYSPCWIK